MKDIGFLLNGIFYVISFSLIYRYDGIESVIRVGISIIWVNLKRKEY